jgi:hypothetical protein
MKKILLTILMVLNISAMAAELGSFNIVNASKGKFATVFIVRGGNGITGGYEVSRVFRRVGTFEVINNEVNVPNSSYSNYGWSRPSHVLVITHDQRELALNKIASNNVVDFQDPTYNEDSEMVHPTPANLKYRLRKAIHFKNINNVGEFQF